MYLKNIEIHGFKSFADKIDINLNNEITCIVGPNGSGKSNIVDAIRWVLGEQSVKALRGDNQMSDVIFAGSKNRNPLNVAYVSLTFDNSDHYLNVSYTEVSIKRKVYRTGESEFYLNNTKCRLKDITDLFIDSGVSKESFNIISQGEVGKILSTSATDRRIIFEEAAGVIKYKRRKEESLKKLDKTKDNVSRINDIINEIESQIEPLKEQSIKAKEYLNVKENLSKIEIALIATEITEINKKYQESTNRINQIKEELVRINAKATETKTDSLKLDLLNLEKEFTLLNQKLLDVTKNVEEINNKRMMLQERSKYDASSVKVHENLINLKEKKLSISNNIEVYQKEIIYNKDKLNEETNLLSKLNVDLSDNKTRKNELVNKYNDLNKSIIGIENKIEILNNNIESNTTYPIAVKKILDNPRLSGIHNVLGNLIDMEIKYIKAIDIGLSSSKSFVVVDNENDAKGAIEYLKSNKLGRATFFPINVIKPKDIDYETARTLKGDTAYLGTLSNYVKVDNKYLNIILNQLGNVLLVTDIDNANRISRIIQNRYKIITLDGEVIHVGGTISGGDGFNKSSLMIKQDLEKAKADLEHKKLEQNNFDNEIKKVDLEINKLVDKVYDQKGVVISLQDEISKKNNDLINLNQNLKDVDFEIDSLEMLEGEVINQEESLMTDAYFKAVKEKEFLIKDIDYKNREISDIKSKIEEIFDLNKVNNSMINQLNNELKELEISNSKMDVKLDNYLNTLSEEYEITYEKAKNDYHLELEYDKAKETVYEYKSKLKEIGMVNILAIEEYDKVSTRYNFLTSQKNDLINAQNTLLEIISEMDEVMKSEFMNTFKKIEKEFSLVFKELFNGGEAKISLTDEENILETGIDIIASPAGKALKSINVLSGGEKTLTAISLLFAILNIKGVPFCIFDEVEAALDEANVDIFGHYLDNYRDKTQFLLITHKKRTMEYAKTLYGITMQESGVSKLVSVKLDSN